MATTESNKSHINENKAKIFAVEQKVMDNKRDCYATRSAVLENRSLIQRNYEAAFNGNRQLANANTDALFRNRLALIKNLNVGTDAVKINFREAKTNESKLEFLDHRSAMNARVNQANEELAGINAQLIKVNNEIMETNAQIVAFNTKMIQANKNWIDNGVEGFAAATPDSNAALIKSNSDKIEVIRKRADENAKKNTANYDQTKTNRLHIEANSSQIYARREEIEANRERVKKNSEKITSVAFQ